MSRGKKLVLNTVSSLTKQLISVICGFILPRLFLTHYGSAVNGLVSSIGQFLILVSIFDAGMGVVIEASLYKPLADKNNTAISRVMTSGQRFYKRFVIILAIYIGFVAAGYPLLVIKDFNFIYTFTLVIAISISLFGQYCFGVTNSVLLSADQRSYINYLSYAITILINTIIGVILINLNCSIQIVKLASSIVFLIRPIFLAIYVKKKYSINWHEKYVEEPIKQKWNGFAQHISALVVSNTDIVVLTFFSTLENVSVYSVYFLVINSIKEIINAMTAGIKSLLGDMIARNEKARLDELFTMIEWTLHTTVTFIFAMTASLIVPFIQIYTRGIEDTNYEVPLFALVLCIAYAIYCLRMPYFSMIMAAGHFKQTQSSAIIEAVINLVVSIIMVFKFGLIGVAFGTLVAMMYRLIYLVRYMSKFMLNRSFFSFIKNILLDILSFAIIFITAYTLKTEVSGYFAWIILSIKIGLFCIVECIALNFIFYSNQVKNVARIIRNRYR